MQNRADPHARGSAFQIARTDPPAGMFIEMAAAAFAKVLDSISDTCPFPVGGLKLTWHRSERLYRFWRL
ncbi:hypothetical protein GA0061098_1016142 [Bradyrhizobium shewense]|uniref:Uncharacterized protein n=1 Tax=Bradyrhizobium shewense TaxID=1761772 RepID=A0A1C3XIF5_9BRAD|nr:hypothetical protein GA0061098_1016142 [Bradyrhizobium shewense]